MKKYVKAQVVAKNNPQGSYAAGCPPKNGNNPNNPSGPFKSLCKACELAK
jgi:hypothetical protein